MTGIAIGQHTSSRFNEELEQVRASVLEMGGMVERQLQVALNCLGGASAEIVAQVAREEQLVNQLERRIDDECSKILATRAPAASDLRLLLAVLKASTDLERVGDESEKIAAISVRMEDSWGRPRKTRELRHVGQIVQEMLHGALDAFARLDARLALEVARRDRAVDEEYESIQRRSVTFMMEDPRSIRHMLDTMWALRSLERIGDHSKNICEYVVYTVHGLDIRHQRLEDVERELRDTGAATAPV